MDGTKSIPREGEVHISREYGVGHWVPVYSGGDGNDLIVRNIDNTHYSLLFPSLQVY